MKYVSPFLKGTFHFTLLTTVYIKNLTFLSSLYPPYITTEDTLRESLQTEATKEPRVVMANFGPLWTIRIIIASEQWQF